MSISNPYHLMVVILEIRSWNPFLVIESQIYFDRLSHDFSESLRRNLLTTPEPSQWRYDALQALSLPIPVCCHLSLATIASEFDPLDGRVVYSFAKDVDRCSTFRLSERWLDALQSDVIVPENERLSRELLAVESHVDIVLQISIWIILTRTELWDFADDLAILILAFRASKIG